MFVVAHVLLYTRNGAFMWSVLCYVLLVCSCVFVCAGGVRCVVLFVCVVHMCRLPCAM